MARLETAMRLLPLCRRMATHLIRITAIMASIIRIETMDRWSTNGRLDRWSKTEGGFCSGYILFPFTWTLCVGGGVPFEPTVGAKHPQTQHCAVVADRPQVTTNNTPAILAGPVGMGMDPMDRCSLFEPFLKMQSARQAFWRTLQNPDVDFIR